MQLVTPAALVIEGSQTSSWVTPPLVCEGSLASGVLTGDFSLGLWGKSASALVVGVVGDSASMSLRLESNGDSSSLEGEGVWRHC